jgi:hypothetical protein
VKLAILISIILLAACGAEKVSLETLDIAKKQATANLFHNATAYSIFQPQLHIVEINPREDSSQTRSCPQGDGWGTVAVTGIKQSYSSTGLTADSFRLVCSTVSEELGCYKEEGFRQTNHAIENGKCQPTSKVPFPIPKLNK